MFDNLTQALGNFFNKVKGRGSKLTEADVREGLRTVRTALLEADVALPVVRDFMAKVTEKAVGKEVLTSVEPSQQLIKIVHDELVAVMGPGDSSIAFNPEGPTIVMVAGLQGSGKTTTTAKLARRLQSKGRRPLMVAADLQRPAAIEQLKVLGEELEIPVYTQTGISPPDLCERAISAAREASRDVVLIDTAGRLHIDEALMAELEQIQARVKPGEVFLVVDAMVGQDAVNSAKEFDARLPITGVILTKLDGDARGGAALSVRQITGKPIKFVGVGEKLDRIEEFHPDRMATRILNMGDIITLVEKAQEVMDRQQALKLQEKMVKDQLTLEDFLNQLRTVKKMGSVKDLLALMPGLAGLKDLDTSEEQFQMAEAIICSMTKEERRNPAILGSSRKKRIADGSGTTTTDVSRLLKQFELITKQLSNFSKAAKFMDQVVPTPGKPRQHVLTAEERREVKKRRKMEKMRKKEARKKGR